MSVRARIFSLRLLLHLGLLRPLLKLIFGVNIDGRENFEDLDQYMIVANHNSHLDILLLFSILPVRQILKTRPVAAQDYFGARPLLYHVVDYLFRPLWIVRGERGGGSLERMKRELGSGHSLIIFPEGTRGSPGQLGKFRTGVGRLAEEFHDIPTIPVFLSGPEKALPKDSSIPLPIWNHVTIGPPQIFRSSSPDFTSTLEKMIRELSESRAANRHRRIKRTRKAFAVAVLGIDGSGKSTVSKRIAKELSGASRVCVVTDRLQFYENSGEKGVQPLPTERLRQALGSYAKTARSLKHYKIPKLAELLLRDHLLGEVQRWYSPEILVLDGSPLINLTAWAKLYKQDAFDLDVCSAAIRVLTGRREGIARSDPVFRKLPELAALDRLGLAGLALPDVVIMLDVDPTVSVSRIRARGEKRQVHETEEKLARLREGYLMVCKVVERDFGIPVRILDGNLELAEVTRSALAFAEQLRGGEHVDVRT